MNPILRGILAVVATGAWVSASEFFRNQVLLNASWVAHFRGLGIEFPSRPVNGVMWIVWSFLFALAIFLVSRRFNLFLTALACWFMGFVLMWVATWNLSVLPLGILAYAVPLSLLEAFVGALIVRSISPGKER